MKTEPTEARCHIMTRSFGNGCGDEIMEREAAEEAVSIAFKEGQSYPKIKQLEWDFYGVYYSARTPIGEYVIKEDVNYYDISNNNGCILTYNGIPIGKNHLVFDNTKSYAQKDFEARIKECLDL